MRFVFNTDGQYGAEHGTVKIDYVRFYGEV